MSKHRPTQMNTIKYNLCVVLCLVALAKGLTVVPEQIPFSDPEITNANRGFYTWYNNNAMPLPKAPYFEYYRFSWNTIEKGLNQYDFSAFDYQAKRCCDRPGCSFGFRYMATQPEYITVLPTYLTDAMPKAYLVNNTYAKAIVPDWNDPYFLERSRALLNATANHIRTNNFSCVGHVDIGLYGWWGEGHTSWITYPLPSGAQAATNESQYAIVDMHLEAFKGMQLYAMTDNAIMTLYAFAQSPTVGMRRDSLGNPVFDYLKTKASWSEVQNRWKQAPFITELYGDYPKSSNMSEALRQVKEFHVTLVANGNGIPKITNDTMPFQDQLYWMDTGKSAGFRLTIEQLQVVEPVGSTITINITWNNHGVAPIYEAWNVNLALISNRSSIAQGTSKVDLRTVMPESPVSFVDQFDISTVQKGEYSIQLQIIDPTNHNMPLALAIKGAGDNTEYTFGSFMVDPSISPPSSTTGPSTRTPSALSTSNSQGNINALMTGLILGLIMLVV